MVLLWSTLATRDVGLAVTALGRMRPIPPTTSWVTYLRCHDDIGWAVADEDAWAAGLDPVAHRRFLSDFYAGEHPGSFARGAVFQANPRTGDRRISGTAASLCGIEAAELAGDAAGVRAGVERLLLMYSVVYAFGGIPLLYMGDELALLNDRHWADDPTHAGDNRWLHRPPMDWSAAARRHDRTTTAGEVFARMAELGAVRAAALALRAGDRPGVRGVGRHVLAVDRRHPRTGRFVALAAFSDEVVRLDRTAALGDLAAGAQVLLASPGVEVTGQQVVLPAWGYAWVAEP